MRKFPVWVVMVGILVSFTVNATRTQRQRPNMRVPLQDREFTEEIGRENVQVFFDDEGVKAPTPPPLPATKIEPREVVDVKKILDNPLPKPEKGERKPPEESKEREQDPKKRGQAPPTDLVAPSQGNKQAIDAINKMEDKQMEKAKMAIRGISESLLPDVPDVVDKTKAMIADMKEKGLLGAAPDMAKKTGHFAER